MATPKAVTDDTGSPELDRLRVAMKFSMWGWGFYWPGGGLLLILYGLDLISLGILVLSLAGFFLLLRSGALRTTSSRTLRQMWVERPMYLLLPLIMFAFLGPLFGFLTNLGLALFAAVMLGGVVFSAVRLFEYQRARDRPLRADGADQLFILFAVQAVSASFIFLDALTAEGLTGSIGAVVVFNNWMTLLYPALLLVASRPFRETLENPLRKPQAVDGTVPEPTPA